MMNDWACHITHVSNVVISVDEYVYVFNQLCAQLLRLTIFFFILVGLRWAQEHIRAKHKCAFLSFLYSYIHCAFQLSSYYLDNG